MKSKGTDRLSRPGLGGGRVGGGVQSSKRLDFVGWGFFLSFSAISDLKLNKKKTNAMWISSAKKNETKPPGFKPLGINLSYKHEKNNNLNLFIHNIARKFP